LGDGIVGWCVPAHAPKGDGEVGKKGKLLEEGGEEKRVRRETAREREFPKNNSSIGNGKEKHGGGVGGAISGEMLRGSRA